MAMSDTRFRQIYGAIGGHMRVEGELFPHHLPNIEKDAAARLKESLDVSGGEFQEFLQRLRRTFVFDRGETI